MDKPFVWGANTGLQQRQSALFLTEGQTLEAENITWLGEAALQMRLGTAAESLSGSTITGEIQWLQAFLPADGGAEELWAAANNSGSVVVEKRVSGAWSTVSMSDTLTVGNLRYMHAAALNGKLFIAYDSDVNRLHVRDTDGTVRRVGLIKPDAPTVADTGAGAYGNTARRYRVSFRIKTGSTVVAESELSDAQSFTPSGSGTAARVTKPTTVDSATHWAVYGLIGSAGDTYDLYEELSEIAVGTTTYDDSTAPASYDGDFPPELGINIPPPSAKFILSDGSRLFLANGWETSASTGQTTPKGRRVWVTRVLGSSDRGDDESIPNSATLDYHYDIGDASDVTGIEGPLFGEVYVFKGRSVYKMVPTGDDSSPFAVVLVSDTCGAVNQRVIAMGTNQQGSPAIYFADEHGLFVISDGGLAPLSVPIARDLRAQPVTADESLIAYDPFQQQVLFQLTTAPSEVAGSYNAFVGDVIKNRWAGFSLGGASGGWQLGVDGLGTGTVLAGGGSSVVGATVGAISATATRRLLLGGQDANAAGTITSVGGQCVLDGSTAFTAKARMRMVMPGFSFTAFNPTIYYRNPQGSTSGTLTAAIAFLRPSGPDGESTTVNASTTLDATTDESGIELKQYTFEGVSWSDMSVLDVRVTLSYSGTAFQSAVPPTIDAVVIPIEKQGWTGR